MGAHSVRLPALSANVRLGWTNTSAYYCAELTEGQKVFQHRPESNVLPFFNVLSNLSVEKGGMSKYPFRKLTCKAGCNFKM
jgi:hypothetical protein